MKETINATLVKLLADKYGISARYVRYCLNGERSPSYAECIKKDYKKFMEKFQTLITAETKSNNPSTLNPKKENNSKITETK